MNDPFNITSNTSDPTGSLPSIASDSKKEKSNLTHYLSASILIMLLLLGLNAIACKMLRNSRQKYPRATKYIQETVITTFIGLLAGAVLKFANFTGELHAIREGYEELFMIVLLPPIIFESAINMIKYFYRHLATTFFDQIGGIFTLAVFGTFIATIITALSIYGITFAGFAENFGLLECFAFGALVSSTDPVSVLSIFKEMNADQTLYALIFGESILNDAVTAVFYRTVANVYMENQPFNMLTVISTFVVSFFGSIALGFVIGIICARILKVYFGGANTEYSESQETAETLIGIIIPWCSYLVGEGIGLSGIVTIMFCGISMAKYAIPNLSAPGRRFSKKMYHTLGTSFETLAFLFIGIGFFSFEFSFTRMGITLFLVVFLIINFARFAQIRVLSTLLNYFRKHKKITKSTQYIIIYSGFRGAMAFALATNAQLVFTNKGVGKVMLFITLLYATITIFIFGSLLVPVLEHFGVQESYESVGRLKNEEYCFDKIKQGMERLDSKITELVVIDQGTGDEEQSEIRSPEVRLMDPGKYDAAEEHDESTTVRSSIRSPKSIELTPATEAIFS